MKAISLSPAIKTERYPLIIQRDYPNNSPQVCCFCRQEFINGDFTYKRTWEHLDGNDKNQDLVNLAFSHWRCNQLHKYSRVLKQKSVDLIQRNRNWEKQYDFESLRAREKTSTTNEPTEIDLNVAHNEITEDYLTELINGKNSRIQLTDSINCIALRCRKKTGHGSIPSVRNYLNILACSEGEYKIEKIEGKNYITRREK